MSLDKNKYNNDNSNNNLLSNDKQIIIFSLLFSSYLQIKYLFCKMTN